MPIAGRAVFYIDGFWHPVLSDSAESLTNCNSKQGSQFSIIPFWKNQKPGDAMRHFGELLRENMGFLENFWPFVRLWHPVGHFVNGLWKIAGDSMGNLANLSVDLETAGGNHRS